jgi:hypothetical protein
MLGRRQRTGVQRHGAHGAVAHDKRSKAVTQHSIKEPTPFAAGAEAFKKGKDIHKANPYKSHQREWKRWIIGYQTAQIEAINARPLPAWAEVQEA